MRKYRIAFPDWFVDREWEVESKGWVDGVVIHLEGLDYPIQVYDPVRLAQDLTDELADPAGYWFGRVLVVPILTRKNIEAAVSKLVDSGALE